MKTLYHALTPRQTVFDKSRRDVVLDLSDLAENKIDPEVFFQENYITNGMKQLYEAVFRRLEGSSDDGIFKLTQAMGGGKTHNMITMGLLAQHPAFRSTMNSAYATTFQEPARVLSFSGRQNPTNGIWGYLAEQIGKEDLFKKFYSEGLKAPGQSDWMALLQGEPTVIILDELPPYFQNANTQSIGTGTLADVTTAALSNLLVAIGKSELSNVALIIADLSASYDKGSAQLAQVFADFENETKRLSRNFTPVQQNSDEIYKILRKRLFENELSEGEIDTIAVAYGDELERSVRIDVTNESPQKLQKAITESYPFHPAMRDLYARFKENPGFQQTRGLIRLMRTVVAHLWKSDKAQDAYLIHPFDVDPNDADTYNELNTINDKLSNAVSNDIASNGQAAAEKYSEELANELPVKVARLILMSSLSLIQGATKGLRENEIAACLSVPGTNVSSLKATIIPELRYRSWYLHSDNQGNLLYKNVQNVSAMINNYQTTFRPEMIRQDIVKLLHKLFEPTQKDCYQKVMALPALDEINITKDYVTLIIYQPHTDGKLHPDLQGLYDNERLKNRMLFLTGDLHNMDNIYQQARGIRAVDTVLAEFDKDKVPANDPQRTEALELQESYQFRFYSAVQSIFTKLYYPTKNGLMNANAQLHFNKNQYDGEEQIKQTLSSKRKFNTEITSENFIKKIEAKLFGNAAQLPWNDVLQHAASLPDWDWHKPDALEQVKASMLQKDLWRAEGNWINKGPFDKPDTAVRVEQIDRDAITGKAKLRIKPVNGDQVRYSYGRNSVSETSPILDYHEIMETDEMEVEFLCLDTNGEHQTGSAAQWTNEVTLKFAFLNQGDEVLLEIAVAPPTATVKYTTDGSHPTNGGVYDSPFAVVPQTIIQVIGTKGEHSSEVKTIKAPDQQGKIDIKKDQPLRWNKSFRNGSTADSYQFLNVVKKTGGALGGIELVLNGQGWANLSFDRSLQYEADRVEAFMQFLQEQSSIEGQLLLNCQRTCFPSGQHFLDAVKELRIDFKPEEIEQ